MGAEADEDFTDAKFSVANSKGLVRTKSRNVLTGHTIRVIEKRPVADRRSADVIGIMALIVDWSRSARGTGKNSQERRREKDSRVLQRHSQLIFERAGVGVAQFRQGVPA